MKGRISFISSDQELNKGFDWAKKVALSYSHEADPVGEWYEAALPGRRAFCVRDVAHHAMGAEMLGLRAHTKNMLLRFAQNIARSRQYCTFWEIDKNYSPCTVDYASDKDFWYNLPANFDIMDVCYRMYKLTGDIDYIKDEDFVRFYDWTVHQYADWWDRDKDLLLERKIPSSRLGIPSYCEDKLFENADALIDMLVIEIRGYYSMAEIYKIRGEKETAQLCMERAYKLQKMLENEWWDPEEEEFYQVKKDGKLFHSRQIGYELSLLYYRVLENQMMQKMCIEKLHNYSLSAGEDINVESMSHYPEIFFNYGETQKAYEWLRRIVSPYLKRREYPEVSFAAIGSYICGVAGIHINAPLREIEIAPSVTEEMKWFRIQNCPVMDGEADIFYENRKVIFKNRTGQKIFVNDKRVLPNTVIELNL